MLNLYIKCLREGWDETADHDPARAKWQWWTAKIPAVDTGPQ